MSKFNLPCPHNDNKILEDYAYQVAYDLSHDWLKENATWDDVETAVKLGAQWKEKQCNNSSTMWSEEDEKMVGNIRSIIEKYAFSQSAVDVNGDLCEKKFIDVDIWLKSLKNKVQLQSQFKEWSKEDKQYLEDTLTLLEGNRSKHTYKEVKNWLKSLKQQNQNH